MLVRPLALLVFWCAAVVYNQASGHPPKAAPYAASQANTSISTNRLAASKRTTVSVLGLIIQYDGYYDASTRCDILNKKFDGCNDVYFDVQGRPNTFSDFDAIEVDAHAPETQTIEISD